MITTPNTVVKDVTNLYDDVWNTFDQALADEALQLLSTRWERNALPLDFIKDKLVLDMGCGSGRYSIALKRLGAQKVVGVDLGEGKKMRYAGVEYHQGSVLNLPFPDHHFDFVFFNGVAHHTSDPMQGIREMHRVLKPGGHAWLFVCGHCKFYDMLDSIRKNLNPKDAPTFRKLLELWQLPKQKQFFLTDLLFVPIRYYFSREQLEAVLIHTGFKNLRFLHRGTDFDLTEQVFQKPELAEYFNKNGEGDLRFLMQK